MSPCPAVRHRRCLNLPSAPSDSHAFTIEDITVMKSPLLPLPGQSYHSLEGRLKLVIQPRSQWLHVGETLQVECGAVGRPIPRYQWHRNGVPVPNATKRKHMVRGGCLRRFPILLFQKPFASCFSSSLVLVGYKARSITHLFAFQIPHSTQDHHGRYRCEISSGTERMWTNEVDVVIGMSALR